MKGAMHAMFHRGSCTHPSPNGRGELLPCFCCAREEPDPLGDAAVAFRVDSVVGDGACTTGGFLRVPPPRKKGQAFFTPRPDMGVDAVAAGPSLCFIALQHKSAATVETMKSGGMGRHSSKHAVAVRPDSPPSPKSRMEHSFRVFLDQAWKLPIGRATYAPCLRVRVAYFSFFTARFSCSCEWERFPFWCYHFSSMLPCEFLLT